MKETKRQTCMGSVRQGRKPDRRCQYTSPHGVRLVVDETKVSVDQSYFIVLIFSITLRL
jgi:hypothetical protein